MELWKVYKFSDEIEGLFLFIYSAPGWSAATSPSARIRFNSVMNGVSKRGSKLGNAVGSIGSTWFTAFAMK